MITNRRQRARRLRPGERVGGRTGIVVNLGGAGEVEAVSMLFVSRGMRLILQGDSSTLKI
jgi:hypothetical protein